jgi:hypothetical protein
MRTPDHSKLAGPNNTLHTLAVDHGDAHSFEAVPSGRSLAAACQIRGPVSAPIYLYCGTLLI